MIDEAEEIAFLDMDLSWRHAESNAEWLLTVGGPCQPTMPCSTPPSRDLRI